MDRKFAAIDLVYTAIGAVLIAVCSWITIPTVVPFTLQTFAVFCILGLIGGKRGTISVAVYILIGAIGIPVFSGFKGGFGVILGSTGGYIVGFIFMGMLYWLAEKLFGTKLLVRIAAMLLGLIICYAFGTAWFIVVYSRTNSAIGVGTALAWCVIPFIIPDLAKMALAVVITGRVRKFIK